MDISMNIHTQSTNLEIISEYPSNGHSLTLSNGTIELTLYLSLEQWWTFRRLPRAENYRFASDGGRGHVRDLAEADRLAAEFYAAHGGPEAVQMVEAAA